ncbi:MAG: hypothetical protein ACI8UP_002362 [Porticoccaceae bacterium]
MNPRTVADLSMQDALVQVDTPEQMRLVILQLQSDPTRLAHLVEQGRYAIRANLWDARATRMLQKFQEILLP